MIKLMSPPRSRSANDPGGSHAFLRSATQRLYDRKVKRTRSGALRCGPQTGVLISELRAEPRHDDVHRTSLC